MISVKISNFQSIKEAEIVIDKFTVLSAPNNLGKSATLRAIEQALFPSAGSFVRKGANFSEMEVSWPDKDKVVHTVVRRKGPTINQYMIDGKPYDRVGRDQIPELANLGFFIQEVDSKINLNISKQFEAPFMIEATNQVIGHFLNKFSRASVIQRATKKVQEELSVNVSKIRVQEAELEKIKKELKIIFSEDIEGMVKSLESLEAKRLEYIKRIDVIKAHIVKYNSIKEEIKHLEESFEFISIGDLAAKTTIYAALCEFVNLKKQVSELESATKYEKIDLNKCRKKIGEYAPLKTFLISAEAVKNEVKSIGLLPALSDTASIEEKLVQYKTLSNRVLDIKSSKVVMATVEADLERSKKCLEDEHRVLHQLKIDAKVCPLCGKPF